MNAVLELIRIDARTLLIALSIIISTGTSIYLFLRNQKLSARKELQAHLFKIQSLAFDKPYLEDAIFTSDWDDFASAYRDKNQNKFDENQRNDFLRYEQYCEMIFNLISQTYELEGNEKKVLRSVEFKSWVRTHKSWWRNPLDKHSNINTYSEDVQKMINSWLD